MLRWMGSMSARGLLLAAVLGVCFAQAPPVLSTDSAATVVVLTGSVSLMRDSTPWALKEGDHVRPGKEIVTGPDGYVKFQVSDGSEFEVFPNSHVTFRDNPGNWKDLLNLLLGRVKVHIQKLGGQPNNNRVFTPTAIISVRGTIFDIVVEDEGDSTLVSVDEGLVEVQHLRIPGTKLVYPGETLRVNKNEPLARSVIDKGSLIRGVLRAAADIVYSTIYQNPRAPSGTPPTAGGGTGGGLPGDHGSTTPPPPPPPPAPPSGGGTTPPPPPPPAP